MILSPSLIVPLSFHRELTDEHRRQSLEEESVWLRIRSLTLRLLASLAGSGHTPSQQNSEIANENGVGDKSSILSGLLSQLNQTLQTANQIAEKRIQVRLTRRCRVAGSSSGTTLALLLVVPCKPPPNTNTALSSQSS